MNIAEYLGRIRFGFALFLTTSAMLIAGTAMAQGQDGTRGERNIQIISEMLPGAYDNANQAYFDRRLKEPEPKKHSRYHARVARVEAPALGQHVFEYVVTGSGDTESKFLYSLETDAIPEVVRMKMFEINGGYETARHVKGCDLLWREEAGQFRAVSSTGKCQGKSDKPRPSGQILSQDALWMTFHEDSRSHYTLERVRNFSCYIDVPGVGGGRDIPYKRYEIADIHDKGGKAWVKMDDGMEVSISLQNIRWPMNNLENIFTRHSFVMYIGKKENGEEKEITYAWTIPKAQRIGVNLKWMLVNCFMINNEEVKPFFKEEPVL
jgi:hypothetical protein